MREAFTNPKVKQIEKAIPTKASDFDLVTAVVTSEMMALRSALICGIGLDVRAQLNVPFAQTADQAR